MTRLEEARRRLEQAVTRLEAAVEASGQNQTPATAETNEALEEARRESAALREVAESVGSRLDAAIERLKVVVDS